MVCLFLKICHFVNQLITVHRLYLYLKTIISFWHTCHAYWASRFTFQSWWRIFINEVDFIICLSICDRNCLILHWMYDSCPWTLNHTWILSRRIEQHLENCFWDSWIIMPTSSRMYNICILFTISLFIWFIVVNINWLFYFHPLSNINSQLQKRTC